MPVDVSGVEACIDGLEAAVEGMQRQAQAAAGDIAKLLQEYARAHHPWQNRSSRTQETTLGIVAEVSEELVLISLSAGMDYDIVLETARSGKWSWLWPAIEANKEEILRILHWHLRDARLI